MPMILARVAAAAVAATLVMTVAFAQAQRGTTAPPVDIAKMVGPDDGYGLVITASADGKGSLEMCGCGRMPLGGLPRRVGYERAVLESTKGEAGLLRVDAGGAFDDTFDTGKNEVIPHIRNEWVLRGYLARDVGAINVAVSDLRYLSQMNITPDRETRAERFPMLDRVISANVVPTSDGNVRFQPFVIRQVSSKRLGAEPIRVAIIGVAWPGTETADMLFGYRILDPVAATASVMSEVRKKSDLVVLLAYAPMAKAREIAAGVPGIDVVLAANNFVPDSESASVSGTTHIVPAIVQARSLAEIRGWRPKSGGWTFTPRAVLLDGSVPVDAETRDMVFGARVDYIR